jgi:uncharacterized protein YeaO (DUF488 family)
VKFSIRIKRIYDIPTEEDGHRILVDRLWPRGISKDRAAINEWAKDAAPSTNIRKEFCHQAERMEAFEQKYMFELDHNSKAREFATEISKKLEIGNVTLLYAARDVKMNHALVLRKWLLEVIEQQNI